MPWVLLVLSLLVVFVWLLPSPWAQSHSSVWPGNVYGDSAVGQLPAWAASSRARPSSPDPCHNGGSCSDGIGTFFCECLAGFRGPKCEEDINECASNPCKNGANCTDCVNSYTCTCPSGFSGIHCENNTPDCTERYSAASWDKRLRSLCCPTALGWCVGPLAWSTTSGDSRGCDVCVPSSCFNGGTCVDGINTFTCVCLPGFTGSYCEHNINECDSKPCLNGGTCQDSYGTYKCTCPQGYTGLNCQVREARVDAAVGIWGSLHSPLLQKPCWVLTLISCSAPSEPGALV